MNIKGLEKQSANLELCLNRLHEAEKDELKTEEQIGAYKNDLKVAYRDFRVKLRDIIKLSIPTLSMATTPTESDEEPIEKRWNMTKDEAFLYYTWM